MSGRLWLGSAFEQPWLGDRLGKIAGLHTGRQPISNARAQALNKEQTPRREEAVCKDYERHVEQGNCAGAQPQLAGRQRPHAAGGLLHDGDELYAAVGGEYPVGGSFKMRAEPNSEEAYRTVIRHLLRLNRKERARAAEFIINCTKRSRKTGFAFRAFNFGEDRTDGYVVAAINVPRKKRRSLLAGLAPGVGFKLKARTVVSLVVGSNWPADPSCDVIFADTSNLKVTDAFVASLPRVFRKQRHQVG